MNLQEEAESRGLGAWSREQVQLFDEGYWLVVGTYGKPCLAARAGGAPEVVNEDTGALVEYGNTASRSPSP